MTQIPETLADNWLIGALVAIWSGIIAIGSSKNKENLYFFGRFYTWWRDRRIRSIKRKDDVESALILSLQNQIRNLVDRIDSQEKRLADQEKRHDHEKALIDDEIREVRLENLDWMRYTVFLKRWTLDGIDQLGINPADLPDFPDFTTWREQRRQNQG